MSTLMTAVKAAANIPSQLKKLGKAEMAETVLTVTNGAYELMGENLALKSEISTLKETVRAKGAELNGLKDINSRRQSLKFEHDCYWDESGFPLCSACLEKPMDPALIRMHSKGRDDGYVKCPVCKTEAWSKGRTTPSIAYCNKKFDPYAVL